MTTSRPCTVMATSVPGIQHRSDAPVSAAALGIQPRLSTPTEFSRQQRANVSAAKRVVTPSAADEEAPG